MPSPIERGDGSDGCRWLFNRVGLAGSRSYRAALGTTMRQVPAKLGPVNTNLHTNLHWWQMYSRRNLCCVFSQGSIARTIPPRSAGFDYNSGDQVVFLNNTSWDNGRGYWSGDNTRVENNVAAEPDAFGGNATPENNSWQRSGTVTREQRNGLATAWRVGRGVRDILASCTAASLVRR
jgi:hypothetical protein